MTAGAAEGRRRPGGDVEGGAPLDLDALRRQVGASAAAETSRFIAYAHILDACPKPGCPVCRCLGELAVKALETLLDGQVTDRETRARLDRSAGFCAWHGQLAVQGRPSALGTAIVYESVLRQAMARLGGLERALADEGAKSWWSPRSWLRSHGHPATPATGVARCPPCLLLAENEANYLRTVLDSCRGGEFAAAYAGSAGLCLPHLDLALVASPRHPACARLVAQTLPKLEGLAARLARFVDKHDYRVEEGITPAEGSAWREVVEAVAGAPGLFGNHMPRPARPTVSVAPGAAAAAPFPEALAATQARLDALAFENRRLTERVAELIREASDESARAAGLDYRLRLLTEDRKVLELNLAGERGAARTWERQVRELEAEVAGLRRKLGPRAAADGPENPAAR